MQTNWPFVSHVIDQITHSEKFWKQQKMKKQILTAQLWWGMDLLNLMQPMALILLVSGQVQSRDRKGPSHIQQRLHPLWYCLQLLKNQDNGPTQCLHCPFTLIHKWWWIPFLQFKDSNKCITVFIIYLFTCVLWKNKKSCVEKHTLLLFKSLWSVISITITCIQLNLMH